MRTVEKYDVNKLFILDDFGFDGRGAYYLGKDKDFKIVEDVKSLINSICNKIKPKRSLYRFKQRCLWSIIFCFR